MTDVDRPALAEIGGTALWTQEVHGLGGNNPLFDPAGAPSSSATAGATGRRPPSGSDGSIWRPGRRPRSGRVDRPCDASSSSTAATCSSRPISGSRGWTRSPWPSAHGGTGPSATRRRWRSGWCRRGRQPGPADDHPRRSRDGCGSSQAPRTRPGDPGSPRRRSGARRRVIGGLATIDPATGTIRTLRTAPPAMAAALAEDQQGVWLVAGIRVIRTEHDGGVSLRPGDAVTRVEWHPLGEGEPRVVDVPTARPHDRGRSRCDLAHVRADVRLAATTWSSARRAAAGGSGGHRTST